MCYKSNKYVLLCWYGWIFFHWLIVYAQGLQIAGLVFTNLTHPDSQLHEFKLYTYKTSAVGIDLFKLWRWELQWVWCLQQSPDSVWANLIRVSVRAGALQSCAPRPPKEAPIIGPAETSLQSQHDRGKVQQLLNTCSVVCKQRDNICDNYPWDTGRMLLDISFYWLDKLTWILIFPFRVIKSKKASKESSSLKWRKLIWKIFKIQWK